MQFSIFALTSLFAVLATASNETDSIENLYIRDNNGIQFASFKLQPADVVCEAAAPAVSNHHVVLCGETAYRFSINGSDSAYTMAIYKELGPAFGLYGETGTLPVYCRAGGNGLNDKVCTQVGEAEVVIVSA